MTHSEVSGEPFIAHGGPAFGNRGTDHLGAIPLFDCIRSSRIDRREDRLKRGTTNGEKITPCLAPVGLPQAL